MSSGQRRVLQVVCILLLAFVLFWLGINSIFLMLVALILLLLALLIVKRSRPELFTSLFRGAKKPPEMDFKPEEQPVFKSEKTYVVLSEGSGTYQIAVDRPVYVIGRAGDCNYVLPGDGISRHHLRIEYSEAEGACYAVDEDSSNGTYLNSGKMEVGVRYRLTQGDRIAINDRVFTVEYAHY